MSAYSGTTGGRGIGCAEILSGNGGSKAKKEICYATVSKGCKT